MMEPVVRCTKCQSLFRDTQPNLKALRYNKLPKWVVKLYDSCPNCLTDEYLVDCMEEELITAPNVKVAKEIAAKNFPDHIYLTITSRGCGTGWLWKNFIFLK